MSAPIVFNLGTLVSQLSAVFPETKVIVEGTYGKAPSYPHSYRGYHEDLAFAPSAENLTAAEFLIMIGSALGDMPGHKGGEYDVTMRTRVWIAEHSNIGARIIDTRFEEDKDALFLVTEEE